MMPSPPAGASRVEQQDHPNERHELEQLRATVRRLEALADRWDVVGDARLARYRIATSTAAREVRRALSGEP